MYRSLLWLLVVVGWCPARPAFGSDKVEGRFVAAFGEGVRSSREVTETIGDQSKVGCAEVCAARILCAGFNYRTLPDNQTECQLTRGFSLDRYMQPEVGTIYYRNLHTRFPRDCSDYVVNHGYNVSGAYPIEVTLGGLRYLTTVYCNMESAGGRWTVVISRYNGSENFDRNWTEYKNGFGDRNCEYYLGNDVLHALTASGDQELRIEMESFSGERRYATYDSIAVDDETEYYRLHLGVYNGDAGDAFAIHDGMSFSTYDRDNDVSDYNCAATYHGGFWYSACSQVRLTAVWGESPPDEYANSTDGLLTYHQGIIWSTWLNFLQHPRTAVMMIRPVV